MARVIECGMRIKEKALQLEDDEFKRQLELAARNMVMTAMAQHKAYLDARGAIALKSVELDGMRAFSPYKEVEFYCEAKSGLSIDVSSEKGLRCGLIFKQHVLDYSEEAFSKYAELCVEDFCADVMRQRSAYLQGAKNAELSEIQKTIEIYCESKSMCS